MEKVLVELGFSVNEAKVYLALTELGASSATRISEKSHLHRPNVYESLIKLVEKGLVTNVVRDKVKYFETTDPENIITQI